MNKIAFALLLAAAPAFGQVMHGNGDPRNITPTPNCAINRFFVDDSTQHLYMASVGSPCTWVDSNPAATYPGVASDGSNGLAAQGTLAAAAAVSATSPAYNVAAKVYCDVTAGCAANYTVTTDSCPAINHAAAAAQAAGGGVVLLPAVSSGYACSTQLNFAGYSNVTLQCQIISGVGTPCRIFWNGSNSATFVNAVGANGFSMQGIQILGQNPSYSGYLVDLSGSTNASVIGSYLSGASTATKGICLNCANSGGGGDTESEDTSIVGTTFAILEEAIQMPSAGNVYFTNIVHIKDDNKFNGPFAKAALQLGGANIVVEGNHFEPIASSGGIYSATYVSGGTFPTTGPCTLSGFNHGSTGAIASIAVSGGTPGAITMYYGGTGAASAPTTAALSGTGCSGTATITTVSTPDVHSSVAGVFAATSLGLNGFAFNNNWIGDGFTGTVGDFSALTGTLSVAWSFMASGNELVDATTVFKFSPYMQNVMVRGNYFANCTNGYDLNGLTSTSAGVGGGGSSPFSTISLQPTTCTNQYVGAPNPAAVGVFYAADGSIAPTALTLPGGTKMAGSVGTGGFAQETTSAAKATGHVVSFDSNGNATDSGVLFANTYGCKEGYDHLPCELTAFEAHLAAQTASVAFTQITLPSAASGFAASGATYRVTTTAACTAGGTAGSGTINLAIAPMGGNISQSSTSPSTFFGSGNCAQAWWQFSETFNVPAGNANNNYFYAATPAGTTGTIGYNLNTVVELISVGH